MVSVYSTIKIGDVSTFHKLCFHPAIIVVYYSHNKPTNISLKINEFASTFIVSLKIGLHFKASEGETMYNLPNLDSKKSVHVSSIYLYI